MITQTYIYTSRDMAEIVFSFLSLAFAAGVAVGMWVGKKQEVS